MPPDPYSASFKRGKLIVLDFDAMRMTRRGHGVIRTVASFTAARITGTTVCLPLDVFCGHQLLGSELSSSDAQSFRVPNQLGDRICLAGQLSCGKCGQRCGRGDGGFCDQPVLEDARSGVIITRQLPSCGLRKNRLNRRTASCCCRMRPRRALPPPDIKCAGSTD